MKKEVKIIAVILAAVLVFLCGFALGSSKGIKINVNVDRTNGQATVTPADTTVPPADTTVPPADTTVPPPADTTAPPADNPPAADDTTVAPPADEPAPPASNTGVPSGTDAIVAKYNEVINNAKKEQNVTIHKTSNTTMTLTDCSVSSLTNTINNALQGFMKPTDDTWTVSGGTDAESGKTASDCITPGGRDVALPASAVASATATPEGDGYTMTIKLVEEKSTFDGTNTTNPTGHESCLTPLNLATLDLPIPGAKIAEADMTYPGATLNVTVNGAGKVTKYVTDLPMSGSGTGKIAFASLTIVIEGSMNETYEFTY